MHAQTHRHTHNAPISGTLLLGTLPLPPAVHPSSEICLAVTLAIMLVNAARPCDPILFICVCVCVCVRACVCQNGHGMWRAWFEQSTAQDHRHRDSFDLAFNPPSATAPICVDTTLDRCFQAPPPTCLSPPTAPKRRRQHQFRHARRETGFSLFGYWRRDLRFACCPHVCVYGTHFRA